MIYSDFVQSEHSKRVWLHDSMTAIGQFAFIAPIHRVKHWNQGSGKRTKCWAKEGDCIFCQRGISKINEFTYGIYHENSPYSGGGVTEVSYLSVTLAAHTQFQKMFTDLINEEKNPTDIVFEIKRTKINTSSGRAVNGYALKITDNKVFVVEKYRPSLLDSEEQEWKWVVPEEVIEFLKDKDGDPMSLIDLFIILKDRFGGIAEKDIKKYSVRLINNNVLDLRRAREKWI